MCSQNDQQMINNPFMNNFDFNPNMMNNFMINQNIPQFQQTLPNNINFSNIGNMNNINTMPDMKNNTLNYNNG